jgi:hypothetical protein
MRESLQFLGLANLALAVLGFAVLVLTDRPQPS